MKLGLLHRAALTSLLVAVIWVLVAGGVWVKLASAVLFATAVLSLGFPRRPKPAWLRLLVHLLTILGLGVALGLIQTERIDAVILVVVLGILNRLLLWSSSRDDYVILGAGAALMAIGSTVTPGLVYLFASILFFSSAMALMWSAGLLDTAQLSPEARQAKRRQALEAMRLKGRLGPMIGGGLLLAVALYVPLSMIPGHGFSRGFGAGYAFSVPGASDEMRLSTGGLGDTEDTRVVLRVKPGPEVDPSSLSQLYVRAYSLDTYEAGRFRASDVDASFPLHERVIPKDALNPKGLLELQAPRVSKSYHPQPLFTLGRSRASYVSMKQAKQRLSGSWQVLGRSQDARLRYAVDLSRPALAERLPPHLREIRQSRALQLPSDLDPRIHALAERLTRGHRSDKAKIAAISRHFSRGFRYSLDPLEGEDADPMARFLFEAKHGHCELYAASVAVLLRAAGVPARVNTGYFGGWYNAPADLLEFTRQDAHAWVEAFDPEAGWVFVDATPPDLRQRREGKRFAWLFDLVDMAEALWFNHVVDVNDGARRAFFRGLKSGILARLSGLSGGGGAEASATSKSSSSGPGSVLIAFGIALALGLGLLFGLFRWLRRSRDPGKGLGRELWRLLERDAGEAARLPGAGALARRPLRQLLSLQPAFKQAEAQAAIEAFEAFRYGQDPAQEARLRAALKALAAVKKPS